MKLVEPNGAEKRARDRLTYAEWGKGLSVEGFCEREERLRAHPWSRRAMQTWFLMDGPEVLSSCETFRMVSLLHGAERGSAYGVASVFTEPRLRGKRYASKMMELLGESLKAQDRKVHSSLLFSDVGPALYERSGYRARPGRDRYLAPRPGGRAREILQISEDRLAEELQATPAPAERYLVWPSAAQLDWHIERERIYSRALNRPRPPSVGARVGHSTIFWCVHYASDALSVLLLNSFSTSDAKALLAEAQRAAAVAGVSRVQLWESSAIGDWKDALADVAPVEREGYLPMLRAFDPRVDVDALSVLPRALWI